jgi:subtilisin family serine protease
MNVDLFAPGQSIYSTAPGDEVIMLNGTSMAAPMVSGVAALLKSYFPKLSMLQIKDILMKSVKPFGKSNQLVPGTELKDAFSKLSVTGGVLDIPNAIKLAKKTIN